MTMAQLPNRTRPAPASHVTTINLSAIDLNLLVALEALLKYRNVTHAANVVGLSQPAMSRSLSRLRGMFNDDLLVRTSAGYVRTARGEQLNDRLPATLDAIREIVSNRSDGYEKWRSTIRLALPDHQALILLTPVLEQLSIGPMNTEIVTEPLMPNLLKKLENGELDMAVGQIEGATSGFFQRTLYVDGYACLLRQNHPALQGGWSPDRLYDLCHAVATQGSDVERSYLNEALVKLFPRRCCAVSPSTVGTAIAAAESDMVATMPKRVAVKIASLLPLRMVELPIEVEPYEVKLLWHERSHRNAEHSWIRSQIALAAHDGSASTAAPDPQTEPQDDQVRGIH